jgi:hypothetical protein
VGGVNPLNKNSPTVKTTYGFALDFFNGPPPDGSGQGGVQDFANTGQAIFIDDNQIVDTSPYIDPTVWRAALVAHETGHIFGLCHYYDVLALQSPPPSPLTALDFGQYALGSASDPTGKTIYQTYGRYNTYLSTQGVISEDVLDDAHYALQGNLILNVYGLPATLYPPPLWPGSSAAPVAWVLYGTPLGGWVLPSAVAQNNWQSVIPSTPGKIAVNRQYGYIMDRYGRVYQPPGTGLQLMENWSWRPASVDPAYSGDLILMCGPACHAHKSCNP